MNVKATIILWLIAGVCFLLSSIFMLISNRTFPLILSNTIVSILSFINAYMEYKKKL
ncbi:hypothetical protein [Clostridium sp. D53t1_180928_C8]|uniref:hypothetical protein n=1 Tax=Clostridium sp. D53t1_180928_C8 TaxID=2787101 RepID=UPI0018AA37CB|nr:hypothetical protein [Clostridium sp. D53t1_180928_C8]